MTLEEAGFKSAFDILDELGKAGIQKKRKRHISFKSEFPLSSEVKHANLKKVLDPSPPSKNLSLNSNDGDDQNKGKNFEVELEIHNLANLSLNSIKFNLENKGKILVRFKGEVLEVEKSHRKKKLVSIVGLDVFHRTGWGSGSYRIKPVSSCKPKPCSGCPHLYLTFRWYEGKKQKEKLIGKASRPGAII